VCIKLVINAGDNEIRILTIFSNEIKQAIYSPNPPPTTNTIFFFFFLLLLLLLLLSPPP
jgi:hypothetical protein